MTYFENRSHRTWVGKFAAAFRGVWLGVRGQRSFVVHAFFTVAVLGLALMLQVTWMEGCLLLLCAATVLAAEMFNSALETLAKAIDQNDNQHLADGLDIASAAVLVMAIGAAGVGTIVLGYRAALWLGFA